MARAARSLPAPTGPQIRTACSRRANAAQLSRRSASARLDPTIPVARWPCPARSTDKRSAIRSPIVSHAPLGASSGAVPRSVPRGLNARTARRALAGGSRAKAPSARRSAAGSRTDPRAHDHDPLRRRTAAGRARSKAHTPAPGRWPTPARHDPRCATDRGGTAPRAPRHQSPSSPSSGGSPWGRASRRPSASRLVAHRRTAGSIQRAGTVHERSADGSRTVRGPFARAAAPPATRESRRAQLARALLTSPKRRRPGLGTEQWRVFRWQSTHPGGACASLAAWRPPRRR